MNHKIIIALLSCGALMPVWGVLAQSTDTSTASAPAAAETASAAADAPAAADAATGAAPAAAESAPAPAPAPAAAPQPAAPAKTTASVNTFNRLMKPKDSRNPAPPKDGIHDPQESGTAILQPPKVAFEALPPANSGNYVDWVKSLADGAINPRFDRFDPNAKPVVMDLNIVREVKGSMPDVVYPHKQHTEWLDCSNCHPKPFIPQKGANQISMAAILLGEKCGLCHGKVAFPVAECRKCHSRKKTPDGATAAATTN